MTQEKLYFITNENKGEYYLHANCRALEIARYNFLFKNGDPVKVIEELKKYQNPDGGFGKGLEPDFLLPDSSPLATTLAFQMLEEIPNPEEAIVRHAVLYFENSFVNDRYGWFAVSQEVNNYPHANWWHWENGQTPIDANWGNPTAEIIGYLWKYRNYLTRLKIDDLVEHAINYWTSKTEFKSEHEVYCFIRLHDQLPAEMGQRLESQLAVATKQLAQLDPKLWGQYTPQPVHFANRPDSFLFEAVQPGIENNLDYLLKTMTANAIWEPNWTWGQYETDWPKSKTQWEGRLTIQNLKILKAYGRLK